ncbi:hypothetical protein DBR13_00285 [Aeromonas sp. HMWF015]|nr:hypothetical protein DBR13_00285 [Aeromonas sp. HMWF015]
MKLIFTWYVIVIAYLTVMNMDFISVPDKYFSYSLIFVMAATPITVACFAITAISTLKDKKWKLFCINLVVAAVIIALHRMSYSP